MGLGHAFITTGEGNNTTVYRYGRYGALYTPSSGITSGAFTPTGEGVLLILKNKSAASYLNDVREDGHIQIYELPNGIDENIDDHFQNKFNGGSSPTNPEKSTYNNPEARTIDTYNLFGNNCVTTTRTGIEAGGVDIHSTAISPAGLYRDLSKQSKGDDSIKSVDDPDALLEQLIQLLQ